MYFFPVRVFEAVTVTPGRGALPDLTMPVITPKGDESWAESDGERNSVSRRGARAARYLGRCEWRMGLGLNVLFRRCLSGWLFGLLGWGFFMIIVSITATSACTSALAPA